MSSQQPRQYRIFKKDGIPYIAPIPFVGEEYDDIFLGEPLEDEYEREEHFGNDSRYYEDQDDVDARNTD